MRKAKSAFKTIPAAKIVIEMRARQGGKIYRLNEENKLIEEKQRVTKKCTGKK